MMHKIVSFGVYLPVGTFHGASPLQVGIRMTNQSNNLSCTLDRTLVLNESHVVRKLLVARIINLL